jgi:glycosyltransferase involved in cell wall biosynthesis
LADRVITVSDGLACVLKQMTDVPVAVIPNGFDSSLFPAQTPHPAKLFTILYAGTLVEGRQDPGPVVRALQLCLERRLIPRAELELVFLGTRPESVQKALAKVPNQLPIRLLPRLPHRAALALQTQASVLLLLANAFEQGVMTGKIFDYLAAGRPILAVPDDRDTTAALLRSTGAGVAMTDIESIVRQLSEWYARWEVNRSFMLSRNESLIRTYSRSIQTGELAQLLTQLVAQRPSNSR